MHENREISCTSWSSDQDRSAKALNRTAGHKRPGEVGLCRNTCERAEPGRALFRGGRGGKAQTGENSVPSHMRPTQSGKGMSQGLRCVRQAARERKQERFTALLHHLTVGLLRESFYALQRQASPGIDGSWPAIQKVTDKTTSSAPLSCVS
jgi:RNA-directed DNA polymerase